MDVSCTKDTLYREVVVIVVALKQVILEYSYFFTLTSNNKESDISGLLSELSEI